VKKLKNNADTVKTSSQALQRDLTTVRAELEIAKRQNARLKAKAGKDKNEIEELRAGLKTLGSEFESEKLQNANTKKQLVEILAKVDLPQHGFKEESGGDNSINPDTREEIAQIVHMNEVLRRVLQGERVYRDEMYGKLHSLRQKVGPLLAKVDGLEQTVEEMKAHFSAHDAPIELIMDFVRNFHQWWTDRYNARQDVADGEHEPTDGPET
jgi:outer membrane murein-binding lipoprotein Lpp